MFALSSAGCGGAGDAETDQVSEQPLATGLGLLPDAPVLRRHVLVADLARLRRAYETPGEFRDALVGVWLPDALTGADRGLWHTSFGLQLDDISSFASGGIPSSRGHRRRRHIRSSPDPASADTIRISSAREHAGARGRRLTRPEHRGRSARVERAQPRDRVADACGRGVDLGPRRAADSSARTLAGDGDFAAAAAVLDPITIVPDAALVRPPTGVPTDILPDFPARLVAVGIDDQGAQSRTVKIALVYGDPEQARSDAALIERDLASTSLPGAEGKRFSDIAPEWRVMADGRAVVITALLPPGGDPGTWRLLVERGDPGPLVRPASYPGLV